MAHKIYEAMANRDQHYKLAGVLELDDAYFGDKNVTGKRGRGAGKKSTVLIGISTREVKARRKL